MRRAPLAPSNQGQAIRGQHPTFLVVDESPLIDDKLFIDLIICSWLMPLFSKILVKRLIFVLKYLNNFIYVIN